MVEVGVPVDCQLRGTGPRPIVHRILHLTGLLSILTAPADQAQRPVMTPESPSVVGNGPVGLVGTVISGPLLGSYVDRGQWGG